MGVHRAKEDPYIKEMAKWEHRDVEINDVLVRAVPVSEGGKKGSPHQEYPKMLYKADSADGGPQLSVTHVVHDSGQESIALGQGWFVNPADAVADVPRRQLEAARLAANRVANERLMSEAARSEAAAYDETTMHHVAEIPTADKRGRR